jgi:hypothetical protein
MDRLVHNAYKINLKGESMRKRKTQLTTGQGGRVTIGQTRVAGAPKGGSFALVQVAVFTWNGWQESLEYTSITSHFEYREHVPESGHRGRYLAQAGGAPVTA